MLPLAIQPSAYCSLKPSTFTCPSQKLAAKIPYKSSIYAKPKASSLSPKLFDLRFNRELRRNTNVSVSSAAAVEEVAEETLADGLKERLGVVVKPMQKPRLVLKFIWMEKNIGLALDQTIPGHGTIPLSPYYFWPRKDAWEELKVLLESKSWISQKQMIILLNQATDIINLWQQSGGDLS
ncbi:30S ribosomal protein like [Actinidia chinensis var. chinensis]|uniref:30S ribosomal protein 3, chloroplastic n=1 Tax=Actinidia chinensis var. chinensis TaxID=1590841 RepID=A0A2R6RKM9_ACTCC|nr:30S ribosomal protein like [Actinidia chinensis var. chinensis]